MKLKNTIILLVIAIIATYFLGSNHPKSLGGAGDVNYISSSVASSSFSVTGTAVKVLSKNTARSYLNCSNIGPAGATLALGNNASKSWGIGLPSSSSFQMLIPNVYIGNIYAITTGGTARISCVEK